MIAWRRKPLQNSIPAIVMMIGLRSIIRKTRPGCSRGPVSPSVASPSRMFVNPASPGVSRTRSRSITQNTSRMIAGTKKTQIRPACLRMRLPQS
jgi:hypothetical protein